MSFDNVVLLRKKVETLFCSQLFLDYDLGLLVLLGKLNNTLSGIDR